MNIINEKPQIGGVGINELRSKINRGVGSAADATLKTAEYGTDATKFGLARTRVGISGISTVVSSVASSGATTIAQGAGRAATEIGKNLPRIPVGNMIKTASKYNTFYKLIILVVFFIIFFRVIIDIFRFFGIDIIDIYSYMGWIMFLLIILFFIPHDYSTLKLN